MSKKNNKILIIVLILITLIALSVTVWALFFRDTGKGDDNQITLSPDYAPIDKESNAEVISGDDESKLTSPEGGGAVSLIYQKSVNVDLSDKKASLLFGNPKKSNQNMIVQLVVQDEVLIQSGLIVPGNRVTTLELLDGKETILKEGGYDGKLVVLYYDPVSGEKAVLNTEIPVTVTVSE